MKFENLFDDWRESHTTSLPTRFAPINAAPGHAPWITDAESLTMYQNAISPMDLYLHPDKTPGLSSGGYSTSAVNLQDDQRGQNQIAMVAKGRNPGYFPMQYTVPQYGDIPQDKKKFIPQAQYEHEFIHATNMRLGQAGNRGYLMYNGMPGAVGLEERRAAGGEDRFWQLVRQGIIK